MCGCGKAVSGVAVAVGDRTEINKGRILGGGDMFFMAEVRGASCKYPIKAKGCVREDGEKR